VAADYGVKLAQYADDTQLYVALSKVNIDSSVHKLQSCLSTLHLWFSQNGLVINPDKSEVVSFSTVQQAHAVTLPFKSIDIAGSTIQLTDTVNILGVTLDSHLTFEKHVQSVCKSANYHIKALRHIRSSLTIDMARTVACALVNTRLDYANSVLYGTSDVNIKKLQRVQNSLARVVSCTRRAEHISPVLMQLHWLPVRQLIKYKVAALTYKIRMTGQPGYLQTAVRDYTPIRELRSSDMNLLVQTWTRTTTAGRAFNHAAPTTWNALPYDLRTANTFGHFRTMLRTYLHRLAFCD